MWLQNNKVFCSKHGLTGAQAKSLKCTSEHLTARRDGGTDSDENIVAACMFCNQKRHKTPNPLSPEAYQKKVKDRVLRGKWHGVNLVRTTTS
jgi:5-methylcytosine-specific restriction endonuclease McrA